jgi:hypothetical protein
MRSIRNIWDDSIGCGAMGEFSRDFRAELA